MLFKLVVSRKRTFATAATVTTSAVLLLLLSTLSRSTSWINLCALLLAARAATANHA
jgi:hypothetical protein